MQPYQDPDFSDLSTDELTQIDLAVSQYESLRRRGESVTIEGILARCAPTLKSALERELIRAEAEILVDWGDLQSLDQLANNYPASAELIRGAAARSNSEVTHVPRSAASTVNDAVGQSEPLPSTFSSTTHDWNQRFVIRSELAEGGLGQLFVAHDLELDREVAIKVLQRQFLHRADLLNRFHAEATVTSHLEHPNIVPVHARGTRPDGQPYFAMRLIKGQSLRSLIAETYKGVAKRHGEQEPSLNFRSEPAARDLLVRLITICRAIAFAHHRGWVHRDLKPSNVMVGPFGETVIIDWGLAAKIGGVDVGSVGTAGYMSPEQSKGLLDSNQPSADIYSLGCILYCTLTNCQPEASSSASIGDREHSRVSALPQSVLRPAQIAKAVPVELDAICRKATALLVQDRYATADALANDLEAWLADEPTTVMPETRWQRLRRRMRSNPGASGAILGSVAAAFAALFLLLIVTTRGNAQLKLANERERAQSERANEAMEIAQAHAEVSEQAQQRLMGLLRTFLTDVEQELSKVPGSSSVRRKVLTTSLNQLSQIVDQFGDDAASTENKALAMLSLGDLFLRFGKQDLQLNIQFGNAQLSSPVEAAAHCFAQARQVVEADRGGSKGQATAFQLALLRCKAIQRSVDAAIFKGDLKTASTLADESLEMATKLKSSSTAATEEQSTTLLLNWWAAADCSGRVWRLTDEHQRLVPLMQSAVEALERRAAQQPDNEAISRSLAMAHVFLGDDAFQNREIETARLHYEADSRIALRAHELHPDQVVTRRDLAVSLDRIGNLYQRQGNVEQCIELYDRAQALRESLYEEDPLDQNFVRDLFVSHMKIGDAHMLINHVDQAESHYKAAEVLAKEMVAFDSGNFVARRYQSMCAEVMADLCIANNQLDKALTHAEDSLAASLAIAQLQPASMEASEDVVIGHLKVAKVLQAKGDWEQAIARLQLAIDLADKNKTDKGRTATDPIFTRLKMAEVLLLASRLTEAQSACQELIPQIDALVAKSPEDSVWRRRHYQIYLMMGEAELKLEQKVPARAAYRKALELAQAMIADGQRVETVRADAAEIEKQLNEL